MQLKLWNNKFQINTTFKIHCWKLGKKDDCSFYYYPLLIVPFLNLVWRPCLTLLITIKFSLLFQAETKEHWEGPTGVWEPGQKIGGAEAGLGWLRSVPRYASFWHAARHVRSVWWSKHWDFPFPNILQLFSIYFFDVNNCVEHSVSSWKKRQKAFLYI